MQQPIQTSTITMPTAPIIAEPHVPYNWQPRGYQMPAWTAMEQGVKRCVLVWHRRAGKDLFAFNWIAREMSQRVGLYWHLFPTYAQGKKIAWQGMTKSGRRFIDHFPKEWIRSENNQDMRIEWINNSIYQVVGCDNVDSIVGPNPVGVVLSEWSLCDPRTREFLRPILSENDGWMIYIYTPRGKNHGWDTLQLAQEMMKKSPKRWFAQVLGAGETKAITEEAIELDRQEGMPEEMVKQEYFCSFDASMIGTYYGSLMEKLDAQGSLTEVGYDSSYPVHTAWDLGMRDATSIWFYQQVGFNLHIIDFYENNSQGLAHYADVLNKRGYTYGQHIAPHDMVQKEFGSGKTRLETARTLGLKFRIAKKLSVEDGHNAVRNLLMRCKFDMTKCKRGVQALREYQKEWDDKKQIFRDNPLHNWASHGADAFRYLAVGNKDFDENKKPLQERGESNYRLMARK